MNKYKIYITIVLQIYFQEFSSKFFKVQELSRIKNCVTVSNTCITGNTWKIHSHPLKLTHTRTHTQTYFFYIYKIDNWIHKSTRPYRELDFHIKTKLQLTVQRLRFLRLNNRLVGVREYWNSSLTIILTVSLRTKLTWRKFNPSSTRWWRKKVN